MKLVIKAADWGGRFLSLGILEMERRYRVDKWTTAKTVSVLTEIVTVHSRELFMQRVKVRDKARFLCVTNPRCHI